MGRKKLPKRLKRKKHSLSFDDLKYERLARKATKHGKSLSLYLEDRGLEGECDCP